MSKGSKSLYGLKKCLADDVLKNCAKTKPKSGLVGGVPGAGRSEESLDLVDGKGCHENGAR